MKLLIAYATKTGTTGDCAEKLAAHFANHEVIMANLEKETPELADFDAAVIGSNVRAGKINKAVKQFLTANESALLEKPFGLYLCCCMSDGAEDYVAKNISKTLREGSRANLCFGGEVRMEKQKGIDKLIMKIAMHAVASNNRDEDRDTDIPLPAILPENISRMADAIKSSF